ncbi:hypothetical protein BJX65DRAFT_289615 [Aspergillus insuetus]
MINGFSMLSTRLMALSRRHIWLWCLLTLVFFLVTWTLPFKPPGPTLHISAWSSDSVLRPEDNAGQSRQFMPSDDNAPGAHEPIGLGTLRDVREERFYLGGTSTIKSADGSQPKAAVYDPYPDYNAGERHTQGRGTFEACEGPRGNILSRRSRDDMVIAYNGLQEDFPFPKYGSYEALGLDGYSCTTRFSRLGLYGNNDSASDPNAAKQGLGTRAQIEWDTVNWGMLQSKCLEKNIERYDLLESSPIVHVLPLQAPKRVPRDDTRDTSSLSYGTRTAVILRAWHDMEWTDNMRQHVRSLIMELSLHSGAEYKVFLLTHLKDNEIPLYGPDGDDNAQRLKEKYIPREFWDITVFFNEETLESSYPKVEEHKPVHQHLQPLQIFSVAFPEFDYYWQFEMDVRLTGHAYHFFERAREFAKQQPRRYLWERNAYIYIPGAHGTWEDFKRMVHDSMTDKETIWGPTSSHPWLDPVGPKPPVPRPEDDDYTWGVDEEADLIKFLPIFDPSETSWIFSNVLWNLPEQTPRRASPVTVGRFSRKLLHSIHDAQAEEGVAIVSEMTASSFALWHGLKAVHVPQPLYADGKWTPKELSRIVNKGPPEKMNGKSDSIWNWDHKFDHILYRMSYMFTAQTAEDFYRRWLGYKPDPNQYTDGSYHQDPQGRNWFDGGNLREDLYGPLCLPSMLLHPVKNTAPQKGHDMAVPV